MSSSNESSPYKTPKKTKVSKKKLPKSLQKNNDDNINNIYFDNENSFDAQNSPFSNDTSNEHSVDSTNGVHQNDNAKIIDYGDLDTMLSNYEVSLQSTNATQLSNLSINSSTITMIDICKIYSITSPTSKTFVAFTISNAYGCRDYINNIMNNPSKLIYWTFVQQLLLDSNNISDKNDIGYFYHKNQRPVSIVSQYPKVLNSNCIETIQETFDKFVKTIENKPDPANVGKTYKIHFMNDFDLNTISKKKAFIFVSTKISLPERLSLSGQLNMDTKNA